MLFRSMLNNNNFSIKVVDGTYSNGTTNYNVAGNEIYIKIVDKLFNDHYNDENSAFANKTYLYGVPVLCMKYNGIEYMDAKSQTGPCGWDDTIG